MIFWAALTSTASGCLLQLLEARGLGRLDRSPAPWLNVVLPQFVVYFLTYDAYFYLVHRFFLHGRWGWWIHRWHHDSVVCSPLSGAAFHPLELLFTASFSDVIAMGWPMLSGGALFTLRAKALIHVFALFMTLAQHCGFQLPLSGKLPQSLVGSVHHDVHHSKVQ